MQPKRLPPLILAFALALSALSGCGDSNDGPDATPTVAATPSRTATAVPPTATPVATPTTASAALAGLAVVSNQVAAAPEDSLGEPPPAWQLAPEATSFPHAFSHADWILHGVEGRRGTTAEDGTFVIESLPPGHYDLELRRTLNGNLVSLLVPVTVGDDGGARVVVELDQGRVRSTVEYVEDGTAKREIVGPDGSRLVIAGDQVGELGDLHRRWLDPDGDGQLTSPHCGEPLWRCEDGAGCGDDRACVCTASCPFCEDCGPNVCASPNQPTPYRCEADGGCAQAGDVCTCVSSCPDCDDCALSVCVPSCAPTKIEALTVFGPPQIVVGQPGWFRAIARLDDGSDVDVTYLATWESSDGTVARIDSWGTVTAQAVGQAEIVARIGDIRSASSPVEVAERARVTQVDVHVLECIAPFGRPDPADVIDAPALPGDMLPHPYCQEVVRVGRMLSLVAFVTFADGSMQIVTDEATWSSSPETVASIVGGRLTAISAGTAEVRATVDGVSSAPLAIRVVDQATVVQLSIYPEYGYRGPIFFPALANDPVIDASLPCFDCGFGHTVLIGDIVPFHATARYDTGEWEEVTTRVTWSSTAPEVGSVDATGAFTASAAGSTEVQARLGEATSNPVDVRVVAEATLIDLSIYQDGPDRVVEKGAQAFFRAQASYDVDLGRDATEEATWFSSDETIGGFDTAGTFTGRAAGTVEVWAELEGRPSNRLRLQVFATSSLEYCDPNDVNRGYWSDAFNRVILESSCRTYTPPEVAELRFTVTERERPIGIFDPCLDLYVYRNGTKIRTIREQGCGEPFLAPGAPQLDELAPRYQTRAFWDLKDDAGETVPPGVYTIYGRFYLYFDPVVQIDVAVAGDDGSVPCTVNQCGNGCGYVRACGDDGGPVACPAICREICDCPEGWGITEDGNCEVCPKTCCGPNEECIDVLPPCEVEEPRCCPTGEVCEGLPPCDPTACCPKDALCILPLPSCELECCPPNARCTADVPPCVVETLACCPEGAFCGPIGLPPCGPPLCCPEGAFCGAREWPTCSPRCCPEGDLACADTLFPCESCCDPSRGPCIQGMPACERDEPKCCAPGETCPDALPACPRPDPAPPCQRTGCSGQICANEPVPTTCEFRPEYACYADAACEAQDDGSCGWTETEELRRCLNELAPPN